jgi:hypothetical protein
MISRKTIQIIAYRNTSPSKISIFRGGPVTFSIIVDSNIDLTNCSVLRLDLRESSTDENSPLASSSISNPSGNTFEFSFSTGETNHNLETAWLVLSALYEESETNLDPLFISEVIIVPHNASQLAPDPPNVSVAMTQDDGDSRYLINNNTGQILLGRYSSGSGVYQPVTVGSNLSLSESGVLSFSGSWGDSVFSTRRSLLYTMSRVVTAGSSWVAGNVSGTTSQGTESTNFYAFSQIAAATNGKSRLYSNISSSGPLWPGSPGIPNFNRKVIVNLNGVFQLSASSTSRISIHFTLTSVSTHSSHDRTEKGISLLFKGGSSTGTVEIQTHDGSSFSSSTPGTFPINTLSNYGLTLEWEPGVAVRLYNGATLLCTQTNNLPSGTSGVSQQGICIITENTTSGTGNATLFRWIDCYITEIQ